MGFRLFYCFTLFTIIKAFNNNTVNNSISIIPDNVFNGVYSECFLHLSYSCLQMKTLLYLKELNNLSEVSVIGDYVKFVKINKSDIEEHEDTKPGDTEELAFRIDEAVDDFFDSHVLKFYALGRNITMPQNVIHSTSLEVVETTLTCWEAFVGRKRKGGGGGGGGGHGGGGGGHGGGHDDGGKKKMMMMAMMCMKMKLMMMVPAMMGMMGMMSFKGMMFSMMSFMISKMMLLMKILEKKGGGGGLGGGGGGGGLDGGWPAGGAGGGAWMPAGGQDYAGGGGGGGGGYDANGQWQSRSIVETLGQYKTIDYGPDLSPNKGVDSNKWLKDDKNDNIPDPRVWKGKEKQLVVANINPENNPWQNTPEISFVKPIVRYNNNVEKESRKDPVLVYKRSNVNFDYNDPENVIGQRNNDDLVKRLKRDIGSQYSEYEYNKDNERVNTRNLDGDYNTTENISPNSSAEEKTDNNENKSNVAITNESKEPRQKRSIIELLQNSYIYWINKVLGINNNRRTNFQKYKIVNGIKYVYYPYRMQKPKMPKAIQPSVVQNEDLKPLVAVDDFNKGEIVEGGIESRMMKKKFHKMKDTVNDTMDDNPWE